MSEFKKGLKFVLWTGAGLLLLYMVASVLVGALFIKPQIHTALVTHRPCMSDVPENWGFAPTDYTRIEFKSLDGLNLQGIFFPVENAKGVIVLTHGAADDACAEFMLPLAPWLVDAGYAALLPTLRNFGASEGDLTSFGKTEWQDLAGAVSWLEDNTADDVPITLTGLSMGGGATLIAASKGYGDNIIVLSPFTRWVPMVTWRLKNEWGIPEAPAIFPSTLAVLLEFGSEGFETLPLDYVEDAEIAQPILIIGGRNDHMLPPRLLSDLQQAIGDNATLVWVDAGHNLVREGPTVVAKVAASVLDFLEEHQ
jgi:pimeloyl-ACP methyl ester carboxylesterase